MHTSRSKARRQMNDRSFQFFAPELFGESAAEAGPTLNAKREPVVWSTDPMRRKVFHGPLGKKMMTQTITWVDREGGMLVVSVVAFEKGGEELMEFRHAFLGGIDPILAHNLHRLVAALTFVNQDQLDLAAAAVLHKTPYRIDGLVYEPAHAEAALRTQLGEGYDAAIGHLSDDVVRDIRILRECGLEVPTTMVSQACVEGRLQFTEKFARLGVVSPDQIRARDAARAAVIEPLKPFIDRLLGCEDPSESRAELEAGVLELASRGITDGDLLLAYGVAVYLQNRTRRVMNIANGFATVFGFALRQPDCIAPAAQHVRSVMTDSPRDEQWLRWGLAGICNDIAHGRLPVKRNDL